MDDTGDVPLLDLSVTGLLLMLLVIVVGVVCVVWTLVDPKG